ncbi:MAG: ABC transporter ATP-binding protein [Actinomycetota bacterium]|nr:ABC transporter ATP-binding protein [Actinomycetota bacterium]
MSAIVVDGVSKKFRLQTDRAHSIKELVTRRDRNAGVDQFWALKDVSIEIPEGSMFALVGHNGSGKSTLLRCIAGIYRPTEGSVKVQGRISTLLELGAGFHPDLTGRENVYMNATILGMSRKQIDAVFDEIVEFAGIGDFIDSPVKIYSSGMYVRLGFSVAIHVDPEILIIDEVIAVGDEEFQRKCMDHLAELRRRGVTIVVVTHGMGTVETMCDGAAWLDHGVLQLAGSAGDVASEYLRRVNDRELEQRAAEAAAAAEQASEHDRDRYVTDSEAWFGEDIAIERVFYTDANGDEVTTAITGEPLSINIAYRAYRPVEDPVFGYTVHSDSDVVIAGTHSKADGFESGRLEGSGVVTVTLDDLQLTPGSYRLTIGVTDGYLQHVYDRQYQRHPLTVRRGEAQVGVGFVQFEGQWSRHDEGDGGAH